MAQSGYDVIADEYYDAGHVTSRNFDITTATALRASPASFAREGLILELGAGRGRATEFLGVSADRIVQLDNSDAMLSLAPREQCLLRIWADACKIPLASQQFVAVVGFLVDPFLGLRCFAEAHRMLRPGGSLLLTTPTMEWGAALRSRLGIDTMTTRFRVLRADGEKTVVLPSLLHSKQQLEGILTRSGFSDIVITDHCLPPNTAPVSPDIQSACEATKKTTTTLPIVHVIRAKRL